MILDKPVEDIQMAKVEENIDDANIDLTKLVEEFVDSNIPEDSAKIKIQYSNVFHECYRVNVWTKTLAADRVVPRFNIIASFLIELKDGKIIDRTISA
tara:strand:- start:259 stop:552 length:294 start_codon:yes stop_codon:yes gene_type:complete